MASPSRWVVDLHGGLVGLPDVVLAPEPASLVGDTPTEELISSVLVAVELLLPAPWRALDWRVRVVGEAEVVSPSRRVVDLHRSLAGLPDVILSPEAVVVSETPKRVRLVPSIVVNPSSSSMVLGLLRGISPGQAEVGAPAGGVVNLDRGSVALSDVLLSPLLQNSQFLADSLWGLTMLGGCFSGCLGACSWL